ncbi:nitroreductase family protein [Mangrovimonas sp. ST2L15]|uniref:nitroreductase family protein n=1 Tax=Mangrovimonas sp. ST2L15 TaxID=1645916 RepID=UPI0006B4FDF7|nr:nitroreductase family protein [Mangrovimonas sp. ST2L15]
MEKIKKSINKETPVSHDIHPLIKNRWSPRVFDEQMVSEEDMKTLFEAGRWAPSSNNLQPWAIIWGEKGSETYERIYNVLSDFNQGWVKNAPILLLTAYNTKNPNGNENFHALHDVGLFMATLSIQAESMGIAVHQMGGVKHQDAKKEFNLPEDYHIATSAAIGFYGGDPDKLPEDLKESELEEVRKRKDQKEFIFKGDFK